MIGGAPGVGKSRIAAELCAKASQSGVLVFAGNCYDRDDSVPFVAFVEILEAIMTSAPSPKAFRDALGSDGGEIARLMPQLRRMFPDIPAALEASPEQSRRILFAAINNLIMRAAQKMPVILLLEDLHWADEGTLSLLSHLAHSLSNAAVLVLGTYRDHELDPAGAYAKALDELLRFHLLERITISALPHDAVAAMLRDLSGREPPSAVVDFICSGTEGNPFFVEEMFQHLVERGQLLDSNGDFRADFKPSAIEVPNSLRPLIARRLNRLGDSAQRILGVAAVIGRSFTFRLLHAASKIDEDSALDGIEAAEKAGLISATMEYPEARFQFSHELIRQAVIADLSMPRRQRLHLNVADAIERLYAAPEAHAGDLANHLWQARSVADSARTIRYLAMAAKQAMTRSAGLESITYLSKGLDLLRTLPETTERNEQELELQVRLGTALTYAKGYSAPDVRRTYARARELCQQVGESYQLFRILRGLAGYYSVRAEHTTAFELSEQCLALAQHLNDPLLRVAAHMELGATLFCLGNYTEARTHLESAIALHDPESQRLHAFMHGQDFGASSRARASHVLWFLGYPDQAQARNEEALALARELSHPFTLAYTLVFSSVLHQFLGRPQATRDCAEGAIQLANEQGFPLWAVAGKVLRGWALVEQGQSDGIAQMAEGLASWGSVGTENTHTHQPYFLALLAEAHGKIGQVERGLELLAKMSAAVERTRERSYEAELYRLRGELLLKSAAPFSESVTEEAESCLHKAIAVARHQNAKSMELRAATSLSRFWKGRGKTDEARRLLSEVYGWFMEGFDSGDLKCAKALLDEMC